MRERLVLLTVAVALPFVLGSSLMIFNDGDVRWHLATGQWILDHRALPHRDPFSFTFAGGPWIPIEWGAEALYASAYRLAGFAGVGALVSLALLGLHLIVAGEARRWLTPVGVTAAILLMDVVLVPMMLARPHLLAWPLLAAWLALLLRARDGRRAPPLLAAAIMAVWANLHGSWPIGLVIAAAFALDACLDDRFAWRTVRAWLLFGLFSAAATLLTPIGLNGWLHPLTLTNMEILPLIVEWRPSDLGRTPFFFAAFAIVAVIVAWRGLRLRPVFALLLLLLVVMALMQMRHQALLAIVAAMLLPRALGRAGERPALFDSVNARRKAALIVAAGIAALVAVRLAVPLVPAENGANPVSAIAAVPKNLRARPVLNGYSFGGPLILAGIRPYIDGRADMYGDPFVLEYQRVVDGDPAAFDRAERRFGLEWTILPPRYDKLIARLDRDPRWRRLHSDPVAIVHARVADAP